MFKTATVNKLQPRIKTAIQQLLDSATKNQKNPNDIVLFLSNGFFESRFKVGGLTSYMVGPGERGWDDEHRKEFVVDYLNSGNETFIAKVKPEDVERFIRFSLNLELMIYTHFWETDVTLKELRQLANLVNGKPYDWENEIPEREKYEFIRDEIREVFLAHDLDVGELIRESYHSQLRNAFAHGQYAFRGKNSIALLNYKGKPHELEFLTYDDWEERFLKTALLFYELLHLKGDLLLNYGQTQPSLTIWMPVKAEVTYKAATLLWNEHGKNYYFKQP
jgi:hypothetical protein